MASLAYRRESVQRILGSVLAPAASYTGTAYAPGARVNGNQTSATPTVDTGHGFPSGSTLDCIVVRSGAMVTGSFVTCAYLSATSVTLGSSLTLLDGDLIVNLGSDTGSTSPNYDGSTRKIYSDHVGADLISNSRVTTNSTGEYEYWSKQNDLWELIRDSSGTVVDLVPGAFRFADTVRRANEYATGGDGTSSTPWTGWEGVFSASSRIHFPAGYYSTTSKTSSTANNMVITGDGPGVTFIQSANVAGFLSFDGTAAGNASYIEVRGIQFEQITNALSANAILLDVDFANRATVADVVIKANDASDLTSSGIALAFTDVNTAWVYNLYVRGHDSPGARWGIGCDIANAVASNRGNVNFYGGVFERCTIGARLAESASNLVNNIGFFGTKFVLSGSAAQTDGVGIEANTQVEGLTLYNCHLEAYNNAVSLDAVRAVVISGCNFSQAAAGTTPYGIKLANACEYVDIRACRFVNNSAAGTAIYLDASAHIGVNVGPCRYSNFSTTIDDNTSATGELNEISGTAITGGFKFRDPDITLGRGVDEDITIYVDRASGDGTIKWDESAARYEFSTTVYSGLHFVSAGRVDTGTFLRAPTATELTIASGAVTATLSYHTLDTEGDAASDDLDTINGASNGTFLVLKAADSARTVVLKDGTGNLVLAGDFSLDNVEDRILLFGDGTTWYEISRSDNGA